MNKVPVHVIITAWAPAVIYMLLLSFISHTPGDQITLPPFTYSDKLIHFSAYTILGILFSIREPLMNKLSRSKISSTSILPGLAVGLMHGVGDEIHQILSREFLSYEKEGVIFVKSTTKLKTADFETYMEDCRRFAAMNDTFKDDEGAGLYIALPNEPNSFYYNV